MTSKKKKTKKNKKTFAIFKTGGKQYLAFPGNVVKVEKIAEKKAGDKIEFNDVLLVQEEGKDPEIGKPFLKKATVKGEILEQGKHEKVVVFKYKPKKRSRKKKGHRQPYTAVEIKSIEK